MEMIMLAALFFAYLRCFLQQQRKKTLQVDQRFVMKKIGVYLRIHVRFCTSKSFSKMILKTVSHTTYLVLAKKYDEKITQMKKKGRKKGVQVLYIFI